MTRLVVFSASSAPSAVSLLQCSAPSDVNFVFLLPTPRHLERADLRRVARRVLLEIVADVPPGAVVVGIEGGCGVILPPQRGRLRTFAGRKDRLGERELAEGIVRLSTREALAGEVFGTAERVSDADVAELVDRAT